MNKREFKDRVYGELAQVTRALANPHRLEIIELLAQGDRTVEELANQTGLSIANASQHLQVLKTAQLVDYRRQGNFISYRLASLNVFRAWKELRQLGMERISSIEKVVEGFRKSKFQGNAITIGQLIDKIKGEKVTILDVRPECEYKNGHIAKALSIPIDQLHRRLHELPKRSEIVAYCRGPFCVFADDAVALLSKKKFKVSRLDEGYPDWAILGLPIELN